MKRAIVFLILMTAGLVACAQPKKASGGASASSARATESRAVDGDSAGQYLLAAKSAADEADAAIRETESFLNANDLGDETTAARATDPATRAEPVASETENMGNNEPDSPMGDSVSDGSGSMNAGDESSGGTDGPESNSSNSGSATSGRDSGGSSPGARSGGGDGGGASDLGDMMGGTTGGTRESTSGGGPEAEMVEEESAGSDSASRARGRGESMDPVDASNGGDETGGRERSGRRSNTARSSGGGSDFDPASLENEVNRAEREAIAAARTAGENELERENERNAATTGNRGDATGSRTDRSTASTSEARGSEPDTGAPPTEAVRNARTESGRRTSIAGSTDPAAENERTAREAGAKSTAEAVALRESERSRRTHRRTIVTGPEAEEERKTTEREDSANLRLNKEGTFTDTRGTAMDADTAARTEERKSGLIASDTYQVFVTVFGATKDEAMQQGKIDARLKAYNLLLKEHRGGRRLSERGRRDLRQFINRHGQVTDVSRQSENSWNVTLQIKDPRLRSFLKKLR